MGRCCGSCTTPRIAPKTLANAAVPRNSKAANASSLWRVIIWRAIIHILKGCGGSLGRQIALVTRIGFRIPLQQNNPVSYQGIALAMPQIREIDAPLGATDAAVQGTNFSGLGKG